MRGFVAATVFGAMSAAFAADKLPIMGYDGFSATASDLEIRYMEAKECGLTALMQGFGTAEQARNCLDLAQRAGIKLLFSNRKLFEADGSQFAAAVKDHPALMAYYVRDEPSVNDFDNLGRAVRLIQAVDSVHPSIVNWFGRVDRMQYWYKVPTFEEYIGQFIEKVPTPILSFDQYPVLNPGLFPTPTFRPATGDCHLQTNWYHSLETVLDTSKRTGRPYWAFAISCALRHKPGNDYPIATEGHLRLQQNSNLAYGAQGLWYYNYCVDPKNPGKMFSQGRPLAPDGKRSTVYERMRRVNRELQARAVVFLGAKVEKVRHTGVPWPGEGTRLTGKFLPPGTVRLATDDLPKWVKSLETPDGGAVVSRLTNGGNECLAVVNRSPDKELTLKIGLAPGVKRIRDDGTVVDASLYSSEYWMDPGAMEIFCFKQTGKEQLK
ncbi:MAG: hypothetical protein IJH50_04265 [Kiritimatiellae bacterium]|nr:hypothetical protein [Kiritimatiellia bacterium]